jgi:hypothetical protein
MAGMATCPPGAGTPLCGWTPALHRATRQRGSAPDWRSPCRPRRGENSKEFREFLAAQACLRIACWRNFSGLTANSPRGGNGEFSCPIRAFRDCRPTIPADLDFWELGAFLGWRLFGGRSFWRPVSRVAPTWKPAGQARGSGPRVRQPDEALIRRKSRARGVSVPPGRASGSALPRHRRRRIHCKKTARLMHAKAATPHLRSADVFRKKRSRP